MCQAPTDLFGSSVRGANHDGHDEHHEFSRQALFRNGVAFTTVVSVAVVVVKK
jgi:hypothetical protein